MTLMLVIFLVLFFIVIAGFYSGSETAAYSVSNVRIRNFSIQGDIRATRLLQLTDNMSFLVTTTLIGHNIAVYLGTYILTWYFEMSHIGDAEFKATILLTPFCFIFAEVLPKRLAYVKASEYGLRAATGLIISRSLFRIPGLAMGIVAAFLKFILKKFDYDEPESSAREKLIEQFESYEAEEHITDSQRQMAMKIMEIEELCTGEIMIPISKAFMVREDTNCKEAGEMLFKAGYKRALLCDKNRNPIQKSISINKIIRNPGAKDQPVLVQAEDIISLDANMTIAKAFTKMKTENTRLAVICGKKGGIKGLITLSSLFSKIVGTMKL